MIRVPRLKQNRHGVFSLRVIWQDPTGKRRETQHSLGTRSPTVARLLALQFNEALERKRAMTEKPTFPSLDDIAHKFELDLSRGVMKSDGPEDFDRMMKAIEAYKAIHGTNPPLQQAMNAGRAPQPLTEAPKRLLARSIVLTEAIKGYLKEKEHDNAERTIYEKGLLFNEFKGLLGDLEVNLYDKPTLVQWKNHEMNKGAGASRINKRLGYLNDFFNWCIGNGHSQHQASPVEGLLISTKGKLKKKQEHWKSFEDTDLKAIYGKGYLEACPKPDHYWIPIVALYSGARLNEIAGLPIQNVRIIDGVQAMEITDTKTSKVGRVVPVHQTLIELGFWDYVEQVRSLGAERLFPHTVDGNNGHGKNAARQFANWLDKLGITDPHKVFHSTRSTLITRLHTANANPAHAMQITGHDGVQVQNIHFQTYTHGIGLAQLRDTLNRVHYVLDMESLKASDPTFKAFLNRWKLMNDRKARTVKINSDKPIVKKNQKV
jgi:integrase